MTKAVVLGASGNDFGFFLFINLTHPMRYALGGIGQPLSLLLKVNPLISEVIQLITTSIKSTLISL
jgi:hypothetical protein